ncbi:MAG TPA: hypothetical protein VL125_11385 [Pelobium sp.]|nr:hypothetical protein [Pelobium sp.]
MAELLYVNPSQLIKFIRADRFLLSKPLQHKFANRWEEIRFATFLPTGLGSAESR